MALPAVTAVPTARLRHVTHALFIQGVPFPGLPIPPTSGHLGRWPTQDPQNPASAALTARPPRRPIGGHLVPLAPAPPHFYQLHLSLCKSSGNRLLCLLFGNNTPGAGAAL